MVHCALCNKQPTPRTWWSLIDPSSLNLAQKTAVTRRCSSCKLELKWTFDRQDKSTLAGEYRETLLAGREERAHGHSAQARRDEGGDRRCVLGAGCW